MTCILKRERVDKKACHQCSEHGRSTALDGTLRQCAEETGTQSQDRSCFFGIGKLTWTRNCRHKAQLT